MTPTTDLPNGKREVEAAKPDLPSMHDRVSEISEALKALEDAPDDATRSRVMYLKAQVRAVQTRIRMLEGARLAFDEESDSVV